MKPVLEVCTHSVESAVSAERGGAMRLELCANLMIGGTSPDEDLFRMVRERVSVPVRVLLRPRCGDFLYTESEFELLCRQVKRYAALGADGIVIGVLTPEGTELSSEGLAERLQAEKLNGRSAACFLIGSSFGIDARIKRMADFRLSFSKMTFPHHLMRVMALEQLYRAESILAGTKYHK